MNTTHRNFVRKPPYDFGWDWGPAFLPTGILGNVSLTLATPELGDITVAQHWHGDASVTVVVSGLETSDPSTNDKAPACATGHRQTIPIHAVLCDPDCAAEGAVQYTLATGDASDDDGSVHVHLHAPKLWWPRGYGGQHTYELRVTAAGVSSGRAITKRLGLRRVELVQEPAPPPVAHAPAGTSFYFRINGVPIYAKGSNMIPVSVFEDTVRDDDIQWLLDRALDANMNMLRVWGGGRYQRDSFYEAATAAGILIWQELVFACAMYPTDAPFLASVHEEISQQVARLHHHASIVIWGGNNENEVAIEWYPYSKAHRDTAVVDFTKLYVETVRPAILSADPSTPPRPWVDSSPSNGLLSDGTAPGMPYIKRWGNADIRASANGSAGSWGDVHYYNYDADCEDPSTYPAARFVSEHGVQSFASLRAYRNVTLPSDWHRDSALMAYRNRHQLGHVQMHDQLQRHFRVPAATAGDAAAGGRTQATLFDEYTWLTQLQQARCYETAFGVWRRQRSQPAMNMGILYWQLNDVWQGPTWSSLEVDGTPKLAHHGVRRAFAPLLLSAVEVGTAAVVGTAADESTPKLEVHITSDHQKPINGILTVAVIRFVDAPAMPAHNVSTPVTVKPQADGVYLAPSLIDLLAAAHTDRKHAILRLSFTPTGDAAETSTAFHWLTPPKDALLPTASVNVTAVTALSPTRARVSVSTNATAAFVTVESNAAVGAMSDGAFMLLAGMSRTLEFTARKPLDVDAFRRGLVVRSLRETYS